MQVEARLRAFAAVARQRLASRGRPRSCTSASRRSPSTWRSLEAELGHAARHPRSPGAALTPAGEVLADYVLRAEALLANAGGARPRRRGRDRTLLARRLGHPRHLPPPLSASPAFHARHPASSSTSSSRRPRRRSSSCARTVSSSPWSGGLDVRAELESEPLVEDEVVLVGPLCARGQAAAGQGARRPDLDLARGGIRDPRRASRRRAGELGCTPCARSSCPPGRRSSSRLRNGAGIAAISRFALDLELRGRQPRDPRRAALAPHADDLGRLSRATSRSRPRPQRFLELLREAFAPSRGAPPNSNLPATGTPLVGRERRASTERDRRCFAAGGAPGHAHRRRRQREDAAGDRGRRDGSVDEVADGVYFVALARCASPTLVPGAIAAVLGLPDADDLERAPAGERELMLVLDNLEQLVDAAPRSPACSRRPRDCASWPRAGGAAASPASASCASSRSALDAAVTLFEQRAQAVPAASSPTKHSVTVCERLDRLPLALELAAARVADLPTACLADGLAPRLPVLSAAAATRSAATNAARRRSRGATTSSALPSARAFARISVFAGGCDHDAAENGLRRRPPPPRSLVHDEPAGGHARRALLDARARSPSWRAERARPSGRRASPQSAAVTLSIILGARDTARSFARVLESRVWLDRLDARARQPARCAACEHGGEGGWASRCRRRSRPTGYRDAALEPFAGSSRFSRLHATSTHRARRRPSRSPVASRSKLGAATRGRRGAQL